MKTMVANFRGPQVPKGRNLRRVLVGITRPEKIHGYGLGLSLNSMGIFGLGTQRGL